MNSKIESLLNNLLIGTGLNYSIIVSSELDWKVGPKGVYILCEYGNHHYLANEADINCQGKHRHLEEKRICHRNNENCDRDSLEFINTSKYSVTSSPIVYKVGSNKAVDLLNVNISPI